VCRVTLENQRTKEGSYVCLGVCLMLDVRRMSEFSGQKNKIVGDAMGDEGTDLVTVVMTAGGCRTVVCFFSLSLFTFSVAGLDWIGLDSETSLFG
jgi:hypothetical protein